MDSSSARGFPLWIKQGSQTRIGDGYVNLLLRPRKSHIFVDMTPIRYRSNSTRSAMESEDGLVLSIGGFTAPAKWQITLLAVCWSDQVRQN